MSKSNLTQYLSEVTDRVSPMVYQERIYSIQIFDTSWLDKNIRQNVKNQCFGASCISGTLKLATYSYFL